MQPEQPVQPIYSQPPMQNNSGGFTLKQKRIMLGTGLLVVVFVFLMIFASIFGGQKSTTEITLTSVSARNTEVLRLIDELEPSLTTATGKTYATQAKILLTSDTLAISNYTLSVYSNTYSDKQLENTEITSTIAKLTDRINQNDFDTVFIDSIRFELELNEALLRQLNPETQSEQLSDITNTAIANYASLL